MDRRRLFQVAGATGVTAALGGLLAARAKANPYYEGPLSDHFNGRRFFMPGKPPREGGFGSFLKWQLDAERTAWPDSAPSPHRDVPPARVAGRTVRASLVGHATVLLQTRGLNILTDPVWSERASPFAFAGPKRVNAPGIDFDDLPPVDVVLLSHNHYDHCDVATLSTVWHRDRPRILTPLGNDAVIAEHDAAVEVETLDWNDRATLAPGVDVHLLSAHHWSARWTADRNAALWGAFAITTPDGSLYFAGDTGYGGGDHFREAGERFGPFRLALLPIGAYEPRWFMAYSHQNPQEAVQAMHDLRAERALAIHWGTFRLTNEGIDDPCDALVEARKAAEIGEDDFAALRPGEVLEVG